MNSKNINLVHHFEEHIIKLAELDLVPLSSQLQRITGDTYNSIDFKNLDNDNLNAESNTIIVHIKTGLKFLIP